MNFAIALFALPLALPGDLERICTQGAGQCFNPDPCTQYIERWNNPVQITWNLISTGSVVPGMCTGPNTIGTNSVKFAFAEWGDVHYTNDPCDPAPRAGHVCTAGCTPTLAACSFAPSSSGSVGVVLVTFKDTASYWQSRGGDFAADVAYVNIGANSEIHLNTTTQNSNPDPSPAWGWVEWDSITTDSDGVEDSSDVMPDSQDPAQFVHASTSTPKQGFIDIIGFLTHDLGFVLGMGPSVIDSTASASGSRFPTMFAIAQEQAFAATRLTDCSGSANQVSISGTILGLPARDLEVDDIAAIARGYLVTNVTDAQTVRVTGKVANAYNERGYSVVAISKTCPATIRAGAISYGTGIAATGFDTQYDLRALPPGEYYLYAEPINRPGVFPPSGTPNVNTLGYYFPTPGDCPNFVVHFDGNINYGGCNDSPFTRYEFWNTSDATGESRQKANLLPAPGGGTVLSAGTVVALSDIVNSTVSGVKLEVGIVDLNNPGGTPNYSARGVQVDVHDDLPTPRYSILRFRAFGGASFANQTVQILMTPVLENQAVAFNNELREVKDLPGKVLPNPNPLGGTFDANGLFIAEITLDNGDLYKNYFLQARIKASPSSSPYAYSNLANAWVFAE